MAIYYLTIAPTTTSCTWAIYCNIMVLLLRISYGCQKTFEGPIQ